MTPPRNRRQPPSTPPGGENSASGTAASAQDAPQQGEGEIPSEGAPALPESASPRANEADAEVNGLSHAHASSEAEFVEDVLPTGPDGDTELPANENAPVASEIDREELKRALESLIFVSDRIVTAVQLARGIKSRVALVRDLIAELREDYRGRGIELVEVSNGYQFRSSPASAAYVREFVAQKPIRLTRAQLETLALIAYRQPVTRPEIDDIRGVDSGSAMRVLLERGLIKMIGRKDEPGRPLLYGTAPDFLEFFGLRSLQELPTLREFTELSQENRALFKRKTGEEVEVAEAELAAAEEAAREDEAGSAHVSDEDLAALAAQAEASEATDRRDTQAVQEPVSEDSDVGSN